MNSNEPFVFYTERRLVVLTGRRARNIEELLHQLGEVSGSCIFYHTHYHYLYLVFAFRPPRFYNDFSNWISSALQQEQLAERLAGIDLLSLTSVREIRDAIIKTISEHVRSGNDLRRECPPGDEFHFCEAKSFIMPIGLIAHDVPELFAKIASVSASSLHFHFFESRLRLERPTNDFSQWLNARGETTLARKIDNLNPYSMKLDELKAEIVRLGRRYRVKS
jgi:hypothetical protein